MAQAHWVICVHCGKRFDVSKKGGRYIAKSRRYLCNPCYKAMKRSVSRETNSASPTQSQANPGWVSAPTNTAKPKQPWIVRHWQLLVGAFFLFAGIFSIFAEGAAEKVSGIIGCIFIGLGFLGWFLFDLKREKDAQLAKEEEEANKVTLCPSCGANSKGKFCEYCGNKLDSN